MAITIKNGIEISIRKVTPDDYSRLSEYLGSLSQESRQRFGPHGFDLQSIGRMLDNEELYTGFAAYAPGSEDIIAYAVVKKGFLEHDAGRLRSFGLEPQADTDATFAPSVADAWQGMGIGQAMLEYIGRHLQENGFRRIILWGGVQCSNEKACRLYRRNGFSILGQFEYNGANYDMVKEL